MSILYEDLGILYPKNGQSLPKEWAFSTQSLAILYWPFSKRSWCFG